ncbi:MAG: hypothetical protein ACPHY8_01200 [Patescibacteria group bacterium]
MTLIFTACSTAENNTENQSNQNSQENITNEQASAYESDVILEENDTVAIIQTSK